jgi:hypothetical protein
MTRRIEADFTIEWTQDDAERLRHEISQEGVDFHALIGSSSWDLQRCINHGFIYRGPAPKPLRQRDIDLFTRMGKLEIISEVEENIKLFNLHYPEG